MKIGVTHCVSDRVEGVLKRDFARARRADNDGTDAAEDRSEGKQ